MKNNRWERRNFTGLYNISLTGYTGAGKTTLFNLFTSLNEYSDGKPFATLSTKVRRIKIMGRPLLLSDTIGFIDSLPELLFDAFYTTLGELLYADVILLVVDISEEIKEVKRKLEASLEILSRLSVPFSNIILVANKIDLVVPDDIRSKVSVLNEYSIDVVAISAKEKRGIEYLGKKIIEKLPGYMRFKLVVPKNSVCLDKIVTNCYVRSIDVSNGKLILDVEGKSEWIEKFVRKNKVSVINMK